MTLEDQAEKGFLTDQDIDEVSEKSDEHAPDALAPEPDGAATAVIAPTEPGAETSVAGIDLSILDVRPGPGAPRDYHFPRFERAALQRTDCPPRTRSGTRPARRAPPSSRWRLGEPPDQAGVTVLTGRAMPEGTKRLSANEFIERQSAWAPRYTRTHRGRRSVPRWRCRARGSAWRSRSWRRWHSSRPSR